MVSFYKHDIAAWMDGTESLSDGAYRVYHVVCQLIYQNEGPIKLNEHGIAGRARQSLRAFRRHLNELIGLKKLILENGRLHNSRANQELEKIDDNRMNASKGGMNSGKSRNTGPKLLINNDVVEAPLQQDRSLKDKTRLDKKESCAVGKPTRTEYDPEFEELWSIYPRRDGANPKLPAYKKWLQIKNAGTDPKEIIAGVRGYSAAASKKIGTEFIATMLVFLNQRRWEQYLRGSTGPPLEIGETVSGWVWDGGKWKKLEAAE